MKTFPLLLGLLPGDARNIAESQPHRRESAAVAVWPVTVPAGREAVLTHTVRAAR